MSQINSGFLDSIKSPKDLKKFNKAELSCIAEEIRELLINHVSRNGGHLASNLGVVELTMALLRNFDLENDKIIWDVGHQSYPYKILTGRKKEFDTMRKKGGLSGFPKRSESKYDFFNTGHSSTSISAALGFSRAAKISEKTSYTIAVIGDGALTGGMAFEALNDAGASGDRIIVLLNDNEMSITKNVGGFSEYFSRMRSVKIYSDVNTKLKFGVEKIPFIGKFVSKKIHNAKKAVKYLFSQGMLFEEMGFQYMGPVDGHDIKKLESILKDAKKAKGPVLIHAVTKKGKGYKKAEKDPHFYHGVSSFDIDYGISDKDLLTYSKTMGIHMMKLAKKDKNIVVICPAVTLGCGLMEYSQKYKDRFFDVGIAEQHAVTLAAGMACSGMKPVVSGYSTFMQRAYDQILHDVCLMNLHVVITLDRAGVVGEDGETHQGIYDLAYLSNMPNIKIYAPSDFKRLEMCIDKALYDEKGPVVIRYPKGSFNLPGDNKEYNPNKIDIPGRDYDCVMFCYGRMLREGLIASKILEENNITCSVVDLRCLKPLDYKNIAKVISKTKLSVCIEDIVESGSCSQRISYYLQENEISGVFKGMTLPEKFSQEGSVDDILQSVKLDGVSIAARLSLLYENL